MSEVPAWPVNPSSVVAAADKIVRVSWWVGANYVCRQYCLGLAAVGVFSIIWINVCIVTTDSQLLIAIQLTWCLFFSRSTVNYCHRLIHIAYQ